MRTVLATLDMAAERRGAAALDGRSHLGQQQVERAGDLADRLDGDTRIQRRGVELLVTEQYLDDADIGLLLEQMRGEAMPQGVHADALVDPGASCGVVYGAVELPHGEGRAVNSAGKQPLPRPLDQPPPSQQIEQLLR